MKIFFFFYVTPRSCVCGWSMNDKKVRIAGCRLSPKKI